MTRNNYHLGLYAENLAALLLRLKGYQIIAKRYKTPFGEIDLIARRRNLTIFVEVKARPTAKDALESITPKMRDRITRAATWYLARKPDKNLDYRFDVITVRPPFYVRHLDNAWQSPT